MTFLFNLIISKAAPVSYLKDLSEKRMRNSVLLKKTADRQNLLPYPPYFYLASAFFAHKMIL